MKRLLPPLNATKAFEVAAKDLSFSRAAEDLGVTQGAISKQIRLLEEYLGVSLFKRFPHNIELTDKGKRYYDIVVHSFDAIENIAQEVCSQEKRDSLLTVNILPSLADYWLIPNLKDFKKKYSQIKIKIETGDGLAVNFSKINSDIAIRGSYKPFTGIESYKLMDEEMLCVCSPELLNKIGDVARFSDIKKFPLLEHSWRPYIWKEWMTSVGIAPANIEKSFSFEHFFMLLKAVKEGMGIALLPNFVVKKDLRNRKIVNLLDIKYKTNFTYYLLHPMHKINSYKVKIFKDWIESIKEIGEK